MPTDFRDGKTYPRRGREKLGQALWLARVFDKARAAANDTIDGYIYPCPMDRGVMSRWGITPAEFTAAIKDNPTDEQILAWVGQRVSEGKIQKANRWVGLQRMSLDMQDAEEGVPGAPLALAWSILLWAVVAFVVVEAISYIRGLFPHAPH